MNNLDDFCKASAEHENRNEEQMEELEQERESMERDSEGEVFVKLEGVKEDEEDDDVGCHSMEDSSPGGQCSDSKEALTSNQSHVDIASNMKVEVFPKKTSWRQVVADMEATESEDAIRNFDVLIRLRKWSTPAVIDWLLSHNCCPPLYKENVGTQEGRRIADGLLNYTLGKLKKKDFVMNKSRKSNKGWLHLRLAPFTFPEWRLSLKVSKTAQEKWAKIRLEREESNNQMIELRHQLSEKEKRLKKLKETKELAPTKQFVEAVEKAKKKKRSMMGEYNELENELKAVKKELKHYEKVLPEIRHRKKKIHDRKMYHEKQLTALSTLGTKAAVVERKNKRAKQRLEHEESELKTLEEDRKILMDERVELENALEESREAAYFDAMDDLPPVHFPPKRKDPRTDSNRTFRGCTKYRSDVLRVIDELLEIGVEIESLETIFESVFQCIKFPVRRFPSTGAIHRLFVRLVREGKNPLERDDQQFE